MRTAVLGATGYTGQVLLRILAEHPEVRSIMAASSSQAGSAVRAVDPGLPGAIDEKIPGGLLVSPQQVAGRQARRGVLRPPAPEVRGNLRSPFRQDRCHRPLGGLPPARPGGLPEGLRRARPEPDLLPRAVYGLAEWHTDSIRTADIIANPGCYPTATLLPLLPLAQKGLLKGTVIANAISGISGAGRKEKADLLYVERSENANAYNPGTSHRHAPEIAQELVAADAALSLLFTPHMAPLRRGMAVTTVVELSRDLPETGPGSAGAILAEAYEGRPCITLTGSRVPQTRDVWGSNRCDIGWRREGRHLMLFSVIDNLVKGASGQAVQNMNIRFGIPETTGLRMAGEL